MASSSNSQESNSIDSFDFSTSSTSGLINFSGGSLDMFMIDSSLDFPQQLPLLLDTVTPSANVADPTAGQETNETPHTPNAAEDVGAGVLSSAIEQGVDPTPVSTRERKIPPTTASADVVAPSTPNKRKSTPNKRKQPSASSRKNTAAKQKARGSARNTKQHSIKPPPRNATYGRVNASQQSSRRQVPPDQRVFIPGQPLRKDILCGRGGRANHHPGNKPYWAIILLTRAAYKQCRTDEQKTAVAQSLIDYFDNDIGARFLQVAEPTNRPRKKLRKKEKPWFICPNKVNLDKVQQALRDKYVPLWARESDVMDLERILSDAGSGGDSATPPAVVPAAVAETASGADATADVPLSSSSSGSLASSAKAGTAPSALLPHVEDDDFRQAISTMSSLQNESGGAVEFTTGHSLDWDPSWMNDGVGRVAEAANRFDTLGLKSPQPSGYDDFTVDENNDGDKKQASSLYFNSPASPTRAFSKPVSAPTTPAQAVAQAPSPTCPASFDKRQLLPASKDSGFILPPPPLHSASTQTECPPWEHDDMELDDLADGAEAEMTMPEFGSRQSDDEAKFRSIFTKYNCRR